MLYSIFIRVISGCFAVTLLSHEKQYVLIATQKVVFTHLPHEKCTHSFTAWKMYKHISHTKIVYTNLPHRKCYTLICYTESSILFFATQKQLYNHLHHDKDYVLIYHMNEKWYPLAIRKIYTFICYTKSVTYSFATRKVVQHSFVTWKVVYTNFIYIKR